VSTTIQPSQAAATSRTVPELARRLASHLAACTGYGRAIVVLFDSRNGGTQGVVAEGDDPPAGLEALFKLVCASDPAVVCTGRVHDVALRSLARRWDTDALLVAPCLFGNDVVAMVALPLPPGTTVASPSLVKAVRTLSDRFAAGVVRARLFAAVGLAA
jgi:hypothetical protein